MQVILPEALGLAMVAASLQSRARYVHPTAHYQSPRRRNRGPSLRGARKRARRIELEAKIRADREWEAMWRKGSGMARQSG